MRLFLIMAVALAVGTSAPAGAAVEDTVPRYDIRVDLRPADHRVRIEGEMRLRVGETPVTELVLSVNRAFQDVQFSVPGNPVEVSLHGGFTDYQLRPARPFSARSQVRIHFSYVFDPSARVSYFYAADDVAFASGVNVAWYPQLANRRPDGVGRLRLRLRPGATAVANGPQSAGARVRTGASVSFAFTRPTAFSFVAGPYQVYRAEGAPPVHVVTLSPREQAPSYARQTQRLIAFYGELFAPYAYGSVAIVELPDAAARRSGFSGQSEDGMLWVTPRFLGRHYSWAYYGHEVGHQWWGQMVRKDVNSQTGFYMPDEATAQWGALQAVEHFEGAAAAERFRRTGYPYYALLQNGLGYLSLVAANEDELLDAPRGGHSHLIANSKGFLVLDHLADTMGRDRFRAALRSYLNAHAFGSGSWSDLKAAFTNEAPDVMAWFAPQWFARGGAPDWRLSWGPQGDRVVGNVTQSAPHYRATLEVEVRGACGTDLHRVSVGGAETRFEFPARCAVQGIVLDPHYRVLRWTPDLRALAEAHTPFARWVVADTYPQLGDDIAQRLGAVPREDGLGLAFALNSDLGRAYSYDRRWADAVAAWRTALASPDIPADDLPMAYVELARAARHAGDLETMRRAIAAVDEAEARASAPTGSIERARDIEAGE